MSRQVLESYCHEANCFITLTYAPEHLPEGLTVVPEHLQLFWKRLRKRLGDRKIRYYAVGEYGDETQRPYYHASVFGIGVLDQHYVMDAWKLGHVMVAEFNEKTAQYVAGYGVKKMTSKDDPRLHGRHPEFSRQSNRPGLGAHAVRIIAEALKKEGSNEAPFYVKRGNHDLMLGRYLVSKLRTEMYSEEEIEAIKQQWVSEASEELHALHAQARSDPEWNKKAITNASLLLEKNKGKIASMLAKQKITESRGKRL